MKKKIIYLYCTLCTLVYSHTSKGQVHDPLAETQSIAHSSEANTIDLFILAGQSNAQGWKGDATQYPRDTEMLDSRILLNWTYINNHTSNGWTTMGPQRGLFPSGHFGPEVSFARNLLKAGYKPAIFKFCLGGTNLSNDWRRPSAGGYYDRMVSALTTAITQLRQQGYTVRIQGFIWIQGESDGKTGGQSAAYTENLRVLLQHFRNQVVTNPSLPTILGVDEQHPFFARDQRVIRAHHAVDRAERHTKFLTLFGLSKADETHLTPAGIIEQGNRIFTLLDCLIKRPGLCDNEGTKDYRIPSTGVLGVANSRYYQSFTSPITGYLKSFQFSSNKATASPVTIRLLEGSSCTGRVIHAHTQSSVSAGINEVTFIRTIPLRLGTRYTLQIEAKSGENFQIFFNSGNRLPNGNLSTYQGNVANTTCGRTFPSFDIAGEITFHSSVAFQNNQRKTAKEMGTSEVETEILHLFPNPVSSWGTLTLETSEEEPGNPQIVHSNGRIETDTWEIIHQANATIQIQFKGIEPGLYKVRWGSQWQTVVIQD